MVLFTFGQLLLFVLGLVTTVAGLTAYYVTDNKLKDLIRNR